MSQLPHKRFTVYRIVLFQEDFEKCESLYHRLTKLENAYSCSAIHEIREGAVIYFAFVVEVGK